ncbi:Amino acid transporter, transmembrane family-containing protein [Aphelenchoides fujianensis]|nr:Amino acid transporter, transmembrane family-containing protein [Aphelenchoides fujianensis]
MFAEILGAVLAAIVFYVLELVSGRPVGFDLRDADCSGTADSPTAHDIDEVLPEIGELGPLPRQSSSFLRPPSASSTRRSPAPKSEEGLRERRSAQPPVPPAPKNRRLPPKRLINGRPGDKSGRAGGRPTRPAGGRMEKPADFTRSHGLHWATAMLFIIADCAGGGIIALPTAAQMTGFWTGVALCYATAVLAAITGLFLAECWLILPRHWAAYREQHCRKPYAEIGRRAMGPRAKLAVSVCLNFSQFGTCVVFFLLAAKNVHDFVGSLTPHPPDVCLVIVAVGVVLWPFCLLKSPEDFSFVIVGGMGCTALAIALLVAGAARDFAECAPARREPAVGLWNFCSGLGTFLFTDAGHSCFPSIQHDMRRPADFRKSIVGAFSLIALAYGPVLFLGHFAYGDSLRDSIINSIQVSRLLSSTPSLTPPLCLRTAWIQQTVNLLIAFHCMLTLVLMFSPINQEAEEGGPPRQLAFKEMVALTDRRVLVACGALIAFALLAGGVATVSAVRDIVHTRFEVPCFVKPFLQHAPHAATSTNCCGAFQNVTVDRRDPAGFCNAPDLHFYG